MKKLAAILIAASLLPLGFARGAAAQDVSNDTPRYLLSSDEARRIIAGRARQVMIAIKNRDMRALSTFVHPRKGVRFSPYVYAIPKTDRVLRRNQLVSLYRSRRRLFWGEQDGSGDPIRLTFRQYLGRFVYQQDLLTDKEVGYNPEHRVGPGTDINNLLETYPQAILVRYSHEGTTGPEGGAMDWRQLWLVFEKLGDVWYLVGVANNEWTT